MIDHHTTQRQAWLRELQPRPIVEDTTAALLGTLALIALYLIL